MFFRSVHYWLCCSDFNTEGVLAQLHGVSPRVKKAARPTSKFGPYDYVFIDASEEDSYLDHLLEMLLEKLELNGEVISKLGCDITCGIVVTVRTSDLRYSETIRSDLLCRAARLKQQVTFTYEHVSPNEA